jgi:hypothetical protein
MRTLRLVKRSGWLVLMAVSALSLEWGASAPLNFPAGGHTNYGD